MLADFGAVTFMGPLFSDEDRLQLIGVCEDLGD